MTATILLLSLVGLSTLSFAFGFFAHGVFLKVKEIINNFKSN